MMLQVLTIKMFRHLSNWLKKRLRGYKRRVGVFEPEEAKRVANGLKDCDLIVVTVKGFTWFGECINEFTKLGVPVCCWAVPEPKKRACCSLIQ